MSVLSINVQGFGDLYKMRWVHDLCNKYKVNFLTLHETKMIHVDLWMLRQVWVNTHFDFTLMSVRGMSGGIICIWNNLVFCKSSIFCFENYVVVEGIWIPNNIKIMCIAVYAPQSLSSNIALWSSLATMIAKLGWDFGFYG